MAALISMGLAGRARDEALDKVQDQLQHVLQLTRVLTQALAQDESEAVLQKHLGAYSSALSDLDRLGASLKGIQVPSEVVRHMDQTGRTPAAWCRGLVQRLEVASRDAKRRKAPLEVLGKLLHEEWDEASSRPPTIGGREARTHVATAGKDQAAAADSLTKSTEVAAASPSPTTLQTSTQVSSKSNVAAGSALPSSHEEQAVATEDARSEASSASEKEKGGADASITSKKQELPLEPLTKSMKTSDQSPPSHPSPLASSQTTPKSIATTGKSALQSTHRERTTPVKAATSQATSKTSQSQKRKLTVK